jgi:F-type H+-transporting ATPase subunit b
MMARADGEIDRMRVSMLNEIRDEVADLSVAIASKVIGKVMDEKHQRQLVDQFLDEEMAGRQSVQDGGES